jgi:hypothetical protein
MVGFHKIENGGEVRLAVEIKISTMNIIVAIFEYPIALLDDDESTCIRLHKKPLAEHVCLALNKRALSERWLSLDLS